LRYASLRQNAVIEDVDTKTPRGLDRALFQKLAAGEWIERHQNLLIIGKTGVGKSWIACALGHCQWARNFPRMWASNFP
jgi:DNA replication protein DnaC